MFNETNNKNRRQRISGIIIMKTLEDLRDFINENEDWNLQVNEVIEANEWDDEAGTDYGICNDGTRRLQFNSDMEAEIVDIKPTARVMIGKKIAELREAEGLSQSQLANRCGLSQTHIARVELGKYNTGIDIIDKIVRILDCEIKIEVVE